MCSAAGICWRPSSDPRTSTVRRDRVEEIARIATPDPSTLAEAPHLLRANSGFCREDLMAWCETDRVDYLFGLARNAAANGTAASPPGTAVEARS